MSRDECFLDENQINFVNNTGGTKSRPVAEATKSLLFHARKYKMDYHQLRQVFRNVRIKCNIEVPKVERNRLLELPTTDEMQKFYDTIKDPVHKLIFEFLDGTGLRVAELVNLKVARIDFETNQCFVSGGKGDKDRIVLFGNKLKERLKLYLEGRKLTYLFESKFHYRYTTRRIEQLCAQYKKKSGITKDLTPHTFRHRFMTLLAQAGVTEEKRAILAGHSDSDTQKIYTHLTLGGIKAEAISVLDKADDK